VVVVLLDQVAVVVEVVVVVCLPVLAMAAMAVLARSSPATESFIVQ